MTVKKDIRPRFFATTIEEIPIRGLFFDFNGCGCILKKVDEGEYFSGYITYEFCQKHRYSPLADVAIYTGKKESVIRYFVP